MIFNNSNRINQLIYGVDQRDGPEGLGNGMGGPGGPGAEGPGEGPAGLGNGVGGLSGSGVPGDPNSEGGYSELDAYLDRVGYQVKGIIGKVIGKVVDAASLSNPVTAVANVLSKVATDKTFGKHLEGLISESLQNAGMPASKANTVANTSVSGLVDKVKNNTDGLSIGERDEYIANNLNTLIGSEIGTTAVDTASTESNSESNSESTDDTRSLFDDFVDSWFTSKDYNEKFGVDEFADTWTANTGKSWDFSDPQGKQNWRTWFNRLEANGQDQNEGFKKYAAEMGMAGQEKVLWNQLKEALNSKSADDLFQDSATHLADAANNYETNILDALAKQTNTLDSTTDLLNDSRIQQDSYIDDYTNILEAGTNKQGSLLDTLVSDIQNGNDMYAPTEFLIGGQKQSFLNRGARSTADLIARLGQQGYDNTRNYVSDASNLTGQKFTNAKDYANTATTNANTEYNNMSTALSNILGNANMTDPSSGALASLQANLALALEQEKIRQAKEKERNERTRLANNLSLGEATNANQATQIGQNEPGILDYIKALGTLDSVFS